MSQTLIRRLFGAALVLPVILLSVQPSFASEDKKVEPMSDIKQRSNSLESIAQKQKKGNSTQSQAAPANLNFEQNLAGGMQAEKSNA
ncbi:MAG: hypothetical protein IGS23_02075 [Rivularia sp. T60_A2020_040]|nr:hypothetical protein [Rivularia sp. T60_A2020_040]